MNGSGIWPEWQIVEKLGSGAYGMVYKVVRREHYVESYAAIKVISVPSSEAEIDSLRSEGMSMEEVRRFLEGIVRDCENEIRLMDIFKGVQNIVSMDDYKIVPREGQIGWDIYIRMELLTPFKNINRTMSEDEVIKLGIDICSALELCAEKNVIHRDIKLENIFVNDFGFYKLGDFGIARILENVAGGLSMSGSRNYMAPEVVKGNYDATVDLYSLGIVLYQLMNQNRLPFLENDQQALDHNARIAALNRRFNCEPLPPPCNASSEMADIILCATDPDPRMRFANASAMKAALKNVRKSKLSVAEDESNKTVSVRRAAQAPVSAVPAPDVPPPQVNTQRPVDTFATKKKSKAPVIITAVVLCLLIGGAVFAATRLLGGNGTVSPSGKETTETTGTTETSDTETTEETTRETTEETERTTPAETSESSSKSGLYLTSVGNDKTGKVPLTSGKWIEFREAGGHSSEVVEHQQAQDISTGSIIGLFVLNLDNDPEEVGKAQMAAMEKAGAQKITGARVKIGGYNAVQCYGTYPDGMILVCWYFRGDDGLLRKITVEFPSSNTKAFKMVEDGYKLDR